MSAPTPGSPEWLRIVTASKVAAIVGVSPWESPRSMWHKMRGDITDARESASMARGNYLEAGVLAWWADRHNLVGGVATQVHVTRDDLDYPAAATLDGYATEVTGDGGDLVIVEAKTAARMDDWGTPGTDEIPLHYLTQVHWQLAMVPDAERAYVAVLGPFLEFFEYVVERDYTIVADLIAACGKFHESLIGGEPPDLDDSVATFETLRAMNKGVDKGAAVDIDHATALELVTARAAEDEAIARARLADSRVIDAAGIAQLITHNGVTVARQQANRRRPIVTATINDLTGDAA
ncbi:MAG TPA: YqaJ viral recombinase family protein [Cellulomonadaceae bacterium]|nr:YqaJ viral recombinase family protein [Cellulomonadaceae bacterium]